MKEHQQLCQLHINGQHTFFLNKNIIIKYSARLRRETQSQSKDTRSILVIQDFPGEANAFELISRFCYSNGRIRITPTNIVLLHSCAIFLEMTEQLTQCNLLHQTKTFLEGLFYWSWSDIVLCLKSCESFFDVTESSGILSKLVAAIIEKISLTQSECSSASVSPTLSTPESIKSKFSIKKKQTYVTSLQSSSRNGHWWFEDLAILCPDIIVKVIRTMGYYGFENTSLVITRFLIYYLKHKGRAFNSTCKYGGLADTVVYGVVYNYGRNGFKSCRGMFGVLRVVSGSGLAKTCRNKLEALIGGILDEATLDDLLICNQNGSEGCVYDVDLVLRLVEVFIGGGDGKEFNRLSLMKVVNLVDVYIREISPDQNLNVSKFISVAQSLPDCARNCFDGLYKAIDIYLEAHQTLTTEERTRICRCLNYEKLSLEACKDLAKNPKVPPRISVEALVAQQSSTVQKNKEIVIVPESSPSWSGGSDTDKFTEFSSEKEDMKLNLQRMQCRVVELEKICKQMKGQMSKMMVKDKVYSNLTNNRALPRFC